jgi:hypothetical protein
MVIINNMISNTSKKEINGKSFLSEVKTIK